MNSVAEQHPELQDSLGEIPITFIAKVDRFELQHPVATYLYSLGGGLAAGEVVVGATQKPIQAQPSTATPNHKSGSDSAELDILGGGLLCGIVAYAGLRAALRTRLGWKPYARRDLFEGPVPAPSGRFTSFSKDSIGARKKQARQELELTSA